MYTRVYQDTDSFLKLESAWKILHKNSSARNNIFISWEWLETCVEVSLIDELFVICVYEDNGELCGALPLYPDSVKLLGGVRFNVLRHIGDLVNCSEYCGLLLRETESEEIIDCIFSELIRLRKNWDFVFLRKQAAWSGPVKKVSQYAKNRVDLWERTRDRPFSFIELPSSSKDYLHSLSSKFRYQIKREKRDIFDQGGLQLARCTESKDIPLFLENLFHLHYKRWKSKGEQGVFNKRPEEKKFYELFVPKALRNKWLSLYLLQGQDGAVAAKIGYVCGVVCYSLQGGFDPESVKGTGNALLFQVIRSCIDEGIQEYDFLGGESAHKKRWGAQERQGYDLIIGHNSLKNRLIKTLSLWPGGRWLK